MTSCFFNVSSTANLDADYYAYVAALEKKLGRTFAGIRKNGGNDGSEPTKYGPYVGGEVVNAFTFGRKWLYQNGQPGKGASTWSAIAAGADDTAYEQYCTEITNAGLWTNQNPVHLSMWHEQYVTSEGGGPPAGTAADYIAAHRHVWNVIQPWHVRNGGCFLFAFVPHWLQLYHDSTYGIGKPSKAVAPYVVSKLDPGPAYYDVVGADIYLPASGGSFSAAEQWTPLHRWATVVGKPFITGETGIASSKNPAAYLAALDSLLKGWGAGSGAGQVLALCWTSRVASGGDYRMDSDAATLAAFTKLANDPFYGAVIA